MTNLSARESARRKMDPAEGSDCGTDTYDVRLIHARQVAVIVLTTCGCGGQLVREVISNVFNDLLNRFDAFQRRRAQSRFYRVEQGIAFALVIAALLGVGVLAARAIERSAADSASVTLSNAARVSSSSRREVITETVKRQGRTVRLVRHRPGTTVQETVTLPALTVRETHTVTRQEVATVTAIQQVTVTVRETVTCKPKSC